jgi:ArsR family transcriptional regulator, nickel/cobalt-responsive transcriptional repressor
MGHGVEGNATAADAIDLRLADDVARTMQVLATPSRVQIVGLLRRGDASVGQLAQDLGMEQSAVSHQLAMLRHLGVVVAHRQGRRRIYALHDDHLAQLLEQAIFHVEHVRLGAVAHREAL